MFAEKTTNVQLKSDIAETEASFNLYEGESSNGYITGLSPISEQIIRTISAGSLLTDNNPNTSSIKYYLFISSNLQNDKTLDIQISSTGFNNEEMTENIPIIIEVISPANLTQSTSIKTYTLTDNPIEVISDYLIRCGYYLEPYTTTSNYAIPNADSYNNSRDTSTSLSNKALYVMGLSIGWNGNSKLPAGDYSATIKISYILN